MKLMTFALLGLLMTTSSFAQDNPVPCGQTAKQAVVKLSKLLKRSAKNPRVMSAVFDGAYDIEIEIGTPALRRRYVVGVERNARIEACEVFNISDVYGGRSYADRLPEIL